MRMLRRILLMSFVYMAMSCLGNASAQSPNYLNLTKTVSTMDLFSTDVINFDLCGAVISEQDLDRAYVRLRALPSGQELISDKVRSIVSYDPLESSLRLQFLRPPKAGTFDDRVEICIKIPISGNDMQTPLSQDNNRGLKAQLDTLISVSNRIVRSRAAFSKTSRERHLYISGGALGGELSLNQTLYKGDVLKFGHVINQIGWAINLDKGSGVQSDPDFLRFGLNFSTIVPFHRKAIRNESQQLLSKIMNYRKAIKEDSATRSTATLSELVKQTKFIQSFTDEFNANRRKDFFRAIVFRSIAPKIEMNLGGHVSRLLANFLNDSEIQIRTAERTLGKQKPRQTTFQLDDLIQNQAALIQNQAAACGHNRGAEPPTGNNDPFSWQMNLVPAGLESGVALRNPDLPKRAGDPIFRFHTGGSARLTYRFPCKVDLIVNRVELEVNGVNRHLINQEPAFDRLTSRVDRFVTGNKYALKVDFRFVTGYQIPLPFLNRRPSVTITYKNGYFPPLFAFTNSVSVHFTLESDDDTNFGDINVDLQNTRAARSQVSKE